MINFRIVRRWVIQAVSSQLTLDNQDITTTGAVTAGDLHATDDLTVDDAATITGACTLSAQTAGRVLYSGTAGLVSSEAALAYNASTDTLTVPNLTSGTLIAGAAQTLSSTLAVTGATTLTGGLVATVDRVGNIPIGAVAYGSLGTDTTPVAGTLYLATVWLPANKTITGIAQLNGSAVGTDKTIVSLWAGDGSALLANSALAGTTCTGTNAFQEVPFTGTYAAKGPGKYWIGVQVNGTTCRLRTIAASTYLNYATSGTPGAFGTLGTTITPTTSTTADKGPIAYLY